MADQSKISNCKSCNAEIVWMKTQKDKNIAVDVETCDPERDTLFDRARMTCHFETCPYADSHRKAKPTTSHSAPPAGTEGHILAKKLNVALKTLEDIAGNVPDGMRSVEIAKAGLLAVRKTQ